MANFSNDDLLKLNNMWSKVKLLSLSTFFIVFIVVIVVAGIVALILFNFRDKIFNKSVPDTEHQVRRKGCKVIKIEEIKK